MPVSEPNTGFNETDLPVSEPNAGFNETDLLVSEPNAGFNETEGTGFCFKKPVLKPFVISPPLGAYLQYYRFENRGCFAPGREPLFGAQTPQPVPEPKFILPVWKPFAFIRPRAGFKHLPTGSQTVSTLAGSGTAFRPGPVRKPLRKLVTDAGRFGFKGLISYRFQ